METTPLKSFATWARTALIREVNARIVAVLAPAAKERVESASAVTALESDIAAEGGGEAGRDAVADKVAYSWFNRIIALRFMDANGYTGIGIVSSARGQTTGQPEVLADAKRGSLDPAIVTNNRSIEAITALLDGTRRSDDPQGEAYALLLAEYCRHWNRSMPFMFEREGDYTELLIPANLLADDSVLARATAVLTEDVCQDVEVIGWLYQFYISERKDEVFAGFKNNKKAGAAEIPAATQLFTPHWIVRYLVENSVGRLWLLNRPTSRLVEHMEYYIKPVDEEPDFLKISSPEELKIIDPAVGSGHMLTYAFDLLYLIYAEEGYAPADIPSMILRNNLYGTEIDPRAGSLAAFALAMKAASKRKLFLKNPIQPNICILENIHFDQVDLDYLWSLTKGVSIARAEADVFWNAFEHADTLGSLVQPNEALIGPLRALIEAVEARELFTADVLAKSHRVLHQAENLTRRYQTVVANPPYMGSGNMGSDLSAYAREEFRDSRQDLCAMFIERGLGLLLDGGRAGMIMPHSWMFLISFSALRARLLRTATFDTVVHLGRGVFGSDFASVAFVLEQRQPTTKTIGTYRKLYDHSLAVQSNVELMERFQERESGLFRIRQATFLSIPDSPLVFSLGEEKLELFDKFPALRDQGKVAVGLQTSNNPRFLRHWHEVSVRKIGFGVESREASAAAGLKWFPYNKGGVPRRWWGNQELVVNWQHDGAEVRGERPRSVVRNPNFYFLPSISWSNVGGVPAFRQYPRGFIPDSAGSSFFPADPNRSLGIMAFLNSTVMRGILEAIAPTLHFDVGQVGSLPVPTSVGASEHAVELVELTQRAWEAIETSWDFRGSPLLEEAGEKLVSNAVSRIQSRSAKAARRVRELEAANDVATLALLGLQLDGTSTEYLASVTDQGVAAEDTLSTSAAVRDLIFFAVGCMFGRYSLDEPGLILANQGGTLREYVAKVPNPSFLPDKDNVIPIVDGDWFEDDIVARFRQFLRVAFGEEHFAQNLRFVTDSLGVKDLRDYFVKSLYKDHVQRYKKRPIYWMFSSPKGSFSALIYMHRYTPSTVSTVLNEYLREFKSKLEASRQHHVRLAASDGTPREKAAAEKEVDRLRKVLLELDEYEHDVLYPLATQQLAIDLDDGVKTNYPKFADALKKIPGLEANDE